MANASDVEISMRVTVRCKKCRKRLFDKTSATTGFIEMKCPRCGKVTPINLNLRRMGNLRYRIVGRVIY